MLEYEVHSVCFDLWAEKIRSYWKFLGGGDCYVLLGEPNGYVILIPVKDPDTGKTVHGILVNRPRKIPEFRNILWHEMGHIRGGESDDPVENEFLADKWALDTALDKGYVRVAEEIILRCSNTMSGKNDSTYVEAARMILKQFMDFAQIIIDIHK